MKWIGVLEFCCGLLLLLGIILGIVRMQLMKKNKNVPTKTRRKGKYAILIPAREEAKVIQGILKSIQKQTYPIEMKQVYVIVEREEDPTVTICEKYGASVFVRKELENKRRKGYALDECLKEILKTKQYDAYFIFDADNILADDYLEKMEKAYLEGYDLGFGYRNCKNGNDSLIAASSTLTFSMINTIGNEEKMKNTNNLVITGTGFFIAGEWVQKWKGYPFHSLTEDYELSLYATLHSMTTKYVEDAIFFDEQPKYYKDTVHQRIRWIKGFFTARKEYVPLLRKKRKEKGKNYGSQIGEVIGILPVILLVVGAALYLGVQVVAICFALRGEISLFVPLIKLVVFLLLVYFFLVILSQLLLIKENGKLNLSKKMQRRVIFFNPLYLMTYIPCAIKALLKKEVTWKQVRHGKTEIS